MIYRDGLKEGFWRQARPAAEQMIEMGGGEVDMVGNGASNTKNQTKANKIAPHTRCRMN